MSIKRRILLAFLTFLLSFAGLASAALASSLSDVVPGGLPKNNAKAALQVVLSRANNDPNLGVIIAQQLGMPSFNASQLVAVGYSNGAPTGSVNTGESGSGQLTNTADTSTCNSHSKMLVVMAKSTHTKLFICTGCSNLRLFHQPPPAWHPFNKSTSLNVNRMFTKRQLICGIWVTLKVHLREVIHAQTWGKVMGELQLQLKQSYKIQLQIATQANCKQAVPPCGCVTTPSTPTPPTTVIITTCSGGSSNNGTGNAGNCDICSGNNNCTTTVTPPPTPPATCPPTQEMSPSGSCFTPPTAILNKFQEVDVNGTDVAQATVHNVPPGNPVQYCFSSNGLGDFSPSCVVSSTGSAQSTYTAGSETGTDEVCVAITDLVTGNTNASQDATANQGLPDFGKDCQPVTIQQGDPGGGRP
jgi:hypothetical protein